MDENLIDACSGKPAKRHVFNRELWSEWNIHLSLSSTTKVIPPLRFTKKYVYPDVKVCQWDSLLIEQDYSEVITNGK
jgi:hypothetical protein